MKVGTDDKPTMRLGGVPVPVPLSFHFQALCSQDRRSGDTGSKSTSDRRYLSVCQLRMPLPGVCGKPLAD